MIAPPKINVDSVWLPHASSTLAPDVDHAYWVVMVISILFFVLIIGLTAYWGIKYRRKSNQDLTSEIDHHFQLEVGWTVIPLVLCIGLFFVGAKGYINANVPPRDTIGGDCEQGHGCNIDVVASQWNWSFTYPNGVNTSELFIPEDTDVRLTMSSKDVIHSLYIPEFRVKQDVIPGLYTTLWFHALKGESKIGVIDTVDVGGAAVFDSNTALECTEYCGGLNGAPGKDEDTGHSRMFTTVHILAAAAYPDAKGRKTSDFDRWYQNEGAKATDPVALGKSTFEGKCIACHNIDGTKKVGPPLDHLFQSQVKLDDGSSVTADEGYIRESILNSQAKIVSGFPRPSPMPPMSDLSDNQVNGLLKFIESLK